MAVTCALLFKLHAKLWHMRPTGDLQKDIKKSVLDHLTAERAKENISREVWPGVKRRGWSVTHWSCRASTQRRRWSSGRPHNRSPPGLFPRSASPSASGREGHMPAKGKWEWAHLCDGGGGHISFYPPRLFLCASWPTPRTTGVTWTPEAPWYRSSLSFCYLRRNRDERDERGKKSEKQTEREINGCHVDPELLHVWMETICSWWVTTNIHDLKKTNNKHQNSICPPETHICQDAGGFPSTHTHVRAYTHTHTHPHCECFPVGSQ